jgi:hypothetical protein
MMWNKEFEDVLVFQIQLKIPFCDCSKLPNLTKRKEYFPASSLCASTCSREESEPSSTAGR